MKLNRLILFFLLIATVRVYGQVRPVNVYTFGSSSGAYTAIAGNSLTFSGTFLPYDDGYATVTLPDFYFYYGNMTTPQNVFTVNTNGWICMGTSTVSSLYTPISSGTVPNIISVLGDDLDGNAGASVKYLLSGTAPNRVLTFQWTNFKRYQAVGENLNFQVKLYETSNKIEFVYGTMTTVNTDIAQVGLAGATNTVFNNRTTTSNWGASSAGAGNTVTMSLTSTVFPASGLTYSWVSGCTGAGPVAGTLTLGSTSATCTQGYALGLTVSGYSGVVNFQVSTDGGVTWSNTGPTNNTSATNITQTITVTSTTRVRAAVSCGGSTVFTAQQIFTFTTGGVSFLTVTPAAPNVNCGNSVTLTASGANSYVWNTGPVTTSITVTPVINTTYSVKGTSAAGCVETISRTVTVNPLTTISVSGGGNFCGGSSVTLTASGASTYAWSNGGTGSSIAVTTTDVYTVTGTAANGCTGTSSTTVAIADWVQNGSISASDFDMNGRLTRDGNPSTCASAKVCPGVFTTTGIRDYDIYTYTNQSSSPVCVTALLSSACSSGNPIFATAYLNFDPNNLCTNYLADIGSSPVTASGIMSFNVPALTTFYIVVNAVDVGGACSNYSLYVDIPRVPLAITSSGGSCAGFATLASSAANSYLWSTGSTFQSINPPNTGTYTVTATYGNNGCLATTTQSITINPIPAVSVSGGGQYCGGTTVILTASGASTYSWNTGATGGSLPVTVSGNYLVTGTSALGCIDTQSVQVIIADWVHTGSITAADFDMNGRLTRDGNTSTCASTKVCPGVFTTTGVRDYDVYTYTNPNATPVCVTALLGTTCGAANPLFATAYLTSYDPNNQCTNYLADIGSSPVYSPAVMSFNVPAFATFYVVVNVVNAGSTCSDYTLYVDIPRVPLAITASGGNCVGLATLSCSGANTYAWNTGATAQSILPPATGTYTVTAGYGNNGCLATTTQAITINPIPTVSVSGGGQYCGGTTVTLTASGASTYSWNTGATGGSLPVTVSGNYLVTGTSALGCIDTQSVQVTIADWVHNDSITAADFDMNGRLTRDGNTSTCASMKVCPGVFTTTGVRDYDVYTYTNPNATPVCVTALLSTTCGAANPLFAAAYLTSYDPNNQCTNYLADIGSSPVYAPAVMSFNVPAFATFYVVVSVVNAGATCSDYTLYVDIPRVPLAITASGGNCVGLATLSCSSANAYAWNTGATTQSILPPATGTYTVTASYGNNGCLATTTQSITINPLPTVSVSGGGQYCGGSTVTLTASGASTYSWNTGATGASLPVTVSGNYLVTGTSALGCIDTQSVQVIIADWVQNGSITAADLDMNGRLTRDGNPATCALAKVCPGVFTTTGVRDYDMYTYTNPNATPVCVTALLSTTCGAANPLFATAYLTSYDPNNQCTNYLADIGSSPVYSPGIMSFIVPASGTFKIVVNVVNTGSTCSDYSLYVDIPRVPLSITSSGGSCIVGPILSCSSANSYLWGTGATTQSISAPTSGTYSVTATYGNNGCVIGTSTTVSLAPPNAVVIPATATICSGQSITLTASGGSTYQWSTGATTPSITVSPASTTTYTVVVTNSAGCSASVVRTVNVNLTPTVGTTVTASTICSGSFTSITGTGASTYSWQPGGLSGTTITVSPAVTTTYTVTGTSANGCSKTAIRLITVNTSPSVGATATNTTICLGASTSLTANGASTYSWQPGALSGATISLSPTATTTYTVTGTAANGCTNTSIIAITVNTPPTVGTTVTNATICSGSSTTISGTGASTYSWQPGGLSGASITVSPLASTTYTVTGTSVNGCTNTTTRSITVNPSPTITATATNTTICSGSSTSITASGASTYSWQPGALSGTTINVTPASTITYTVTGTAANGCTGTATVTITVNTSPIVGTTVTNATICSGSSTSITGTGASTYSWQPGGLSGTTINVTPASTTTYTVTGTAANGCTGTATRLITVNTSPTVGTTVTNATICSGSSTSISGTGALTYSWQPGALSGTTINVTPISTTTYTVTGTAANGCTGTATRLITVNTSPTVGTTVTNATICSGSSTSITGTGASTYSWQPGALSGASITVSPSVTTTYTVTGIALSGCTNTATRIITVNSSPAVTASATTGSIACGGSTTLSATGAVSYLWQPGGLTGSSVSVSPTVTTTYTVTGTAANGCSGTATKTITVATCGTTVNLKLYIEGYYTGGGLMVNALQNQGVAGATATQTDSITVELRNSATPTLVAASQRVLLNTNGTAVCNFNVNGSYYLAINHRNALQTWSATPVTLSGGSVTYDFSNLAGKAYGSNQVELAPGVFGFFSGDILVDENIDLGDLGAQEIDINNFAFGYFAADVNGDGNVDILDSPVVETNVNNFIFSVHP